MKLTPDLIKYLQDQVAFGGQNAASASGVLAQHGVDIQKGTEDQARDDNGRFASGGGASKEKAADAYVGRDQKISGESNVRETLKDVLGGNSAQSGMTPGGEVSSTGYGHYVSVAMRTGNEDLVDPRYKNTDNIYEEAKRHARGDAPGPPATSGRVTESNVRAVMDHQNGGPRRPGMTTSYDKQGRDPIGGGKEGRIAEFMNRFGHITDQKELTQAIKDDPNFITMDGVRYSHIAQALLKP